MPARGGGLVGGLVGPVLRHGRSPAGGFADESGEGAGHEAAVRLGCGMPVCGVPGRLAVSAVAAALDGLVSRVARPC